MTLEQRIEQTKPTLPDGYAFDERKGLVRRHDETYRLSFLRRHLGGNNYVTMCIPWMNDESFVELHIKRAIAELAKV